MDTSVASSVDRKLQRLFVAMDTDRDGCIDWSDHQRVVDRYLEVFSVPASSRKGRALQAAYAMLWQELLRHADTDQQLSCPQFVAASRALSADTSRFNRVEGISHAVFDLMDADGDDVLSREEFSGLLSVWDSTAPEAWETFDGMDTDKDGRISRQEFLEAMTQFHTAGDPHRPGSQFFGSVA
ncbi:EF-hand domain-containing protein [Streptomyces sp. NPDC003006]